MVVGVGGNLFLTNSTSMVKNGNTMISCSYIEIEEDRCQNVFSSVCVVSDFRKREMMMRMKG